MWARRQPASGHRDWYWAASPEDRREYDAFGPWVDAIRSEAEMPPRFRAAYGEQRSARFLLKVPVNADRSQVRPGMSLYRQVLAVHDDRLDLLRPAAGGILTRSVGWSEIAAVRSMANLLAAEWALLLTSGETISVAYNAVSSRRLEVVTDFIRDRLLPGAGRANATGEDGAVAVADLFFQNMLNAVRRTTPRPVTPVHFEPRDRPCRDDRNRRRLTTGQLILDASEELVIVDRETATRRYFHPTYAARVTYVRYAALSAFAVLPPSPGGGRFHRLRLAIDRQTIDQPCRLAPERVVACLAAHGVPQVAG